MATIFQKAELEVLDSPDAPASTYQWMVYDTEDETVVVSLVNSTVPAFDPFGNPFIDARPKHLGGGIWNIEVRYGPVPPLATGLTIWEYDTTGGREKRYQSLNTRNIKMSSYATTNSIAQQNFNGAIAVDERGPQGVDVAIPKLSLTGKRKYSTVAGGPGGGTLLPDDYIAGLEQLTATINQAAFNIVSWGQILDFDPGEMLLLGAVATVATEYEMEIDHRFEVSRDRTAANGNAVQLVGFTGTVDKPGWDYAWIFYQRGSTASYQAPVPIQYQTEKVYPDGDYTSLIL